jgi:light-regulated signal transduction histidine kinase (bacteriophytochrome)
MESVDLIANLESRVAQRTEEVRERQAELEVLNKELEAFSYSVAHDLRSPLLSIDGFAELLVETCGETLNGDARECLGRITGIHCPHAWAHQRLARAFPHRPGTHESS